MPAWLVADPATLEGVAHIPYCPAFLFSPSLSLTASSAFITCLLLFSSYAQSKVAEIVDLFHVV